MKLPLILAVLGFALSGVAPAAEVPGELSAARYPSIQAALDANPGRMIYVPAGDYRIDQPIEIRSSQAGLFGPGRIVQGDPASPILQVIQAHGVQIRDLTLTRAEGRQDTAQRGLLAEACRELVLDNLQVLDNHGSTAIRISGCTHSQVRNCLVRNYAGFTVDDRTRPGEFGVAFNCIDGTGIQIDNSVGTLVTGNRVIESRLIGTRELWKTHKLGKIVKRSEKPGAEPPASFKRDAVDNWHQGSAIHVSNPEVTDYTQVVSNYIENAGQGIDVHGDHTLVSANLINNAFIGIKAMHGSRHVSILGNQFSKVDLWGILLQPGSASHPGREATATAPAKPPNGDGGSIVANNIITDFGFGNEHWNWQSANGIPIFLQGINDPQYPRLRDVLITGNVVYDSGRDGVLENGKLVTPKPRYKYAIAVDDGPQAPQNVVITNNLLQPGTDGISNVDLTRPEFTPSSN